MIGVGGGFLIVPILVLIYGISTHLAVGTSAVMVVFTAVSSTFAYARQKRIDHKLGLILAIGSIPGAVVGAYATSRINERLGLAIWGLLDHSCSKDVSGAKGEGTNNVGVASQDSRCWRPSL